MNVASEEPPRRQGTPEPRADGWTRPGADDGEGRSPGLRLECVITLCGWDARRLQLRAQRRNFDRLPIFTRVHTRAPSLRGRLGSARRLVNSAASR